MKIHEMTAEECRSALSQAKLARLACEMDGQPYVVPVYLTYDGECLFGFASMGYKIDCMRVNPLVCVEVDDITTSDRWMSLVVFGRYEELPDTPEYSTLRAHARELLEKRATWWEPASVPVRHGDYSKAVAPIFYRILIDKVTGLRASPE
jgi:nitroimidazol reductase NimA-like FMN-containing flavoprotein (pyridoxamine 5'-phosphate oxidase superfamily)